MVRLLALETAIRLRCRDPGDFRITSEDSEDSPSLLAVNLPQPQ